MKSGYPKHLDDFHKERNTEAFYKTKGFGKLWEYFVVVTESDNFQKKIKELREYYGIGVLDFGSKISWSIPPEEWKYFRNKKIYLELRKELRELSLKYGFLPAGWIDLIEHYLFFNEVTISLKPYARNLCCTSDSLLKKDSIGIKLTKDDTRVYPVALNISPYASERDIIDYIKRLYITEILPIQETHRNSDIKIGKFRKGNLVVRKRDRFVSQNVGIDRKKLLKITNEKFKNKQLDEGSIGKIISLQKKKRKEV